MVANRGPNPPVAGGANPGPNPGFSPPSAGGLSPRFRTTGRSGVPATVTAFGGRAGAHRSHTTETVSGVCSRSPRFLCHFSHSTSSDGNTSTEPASDNTMA